VFEIDSFICSLCFQRFWALEMFNAITPAITSINPTTFNEFNFSPNATIPIKAIAPVPRADHIA